MPLHLTKIAYGAESPAALRAWLESHREAGVALMTTRYLPKREAELAGGSLYWIHAHMLIGRSPLLGFEQKPDGKWWIKLEPQLIPVRATPRRAHQGWRYLDGAAAPADIDGGEADDIDAMPPALLGELSRLGLV